MSRLPTLSTPHRMATPPTSGLPTPTHRRPRSSLGPSAIPPSQTSPDDTEAIYQLHAALKQRPPSSMRKLLDEAGPGSPDTPTQSSMSGGLAPPSSSKGLQPRTPITRAKTPNLGVSTRGPPVTPSASRASSRPSLGGRPSIGGVGGTMTPRRVSLASGSTTTPYARRPESRVSNAGTSAGLEAKFAPQLGDKVRMQSMGMEGVLRYLGPTQFREGVWAGVELEGGFKGMGKNNGSVEGVEYFSCAELCGVFCLASRLSAPTTSTVPHASRPGSVASHTSHLSAASGRMTPAAERRPPISTPGKPRTVSSARNYAPVKGIEHDPMPDAAPKRTLLGISTSANAGHASTAASTAAGKISAGSRASKYLGMTAKQLQLQSAREGTLGASVRGPPTATMGGAGAVTPKASRVSVGMSTPAARGRPSLGGNSFVTPKARPRASLAGRTGAGAGVGGGDGEGGVMPPPPSPGKVRAAISARTAELDAQIKELTARNAELESQLAIASSSASAGAHNDNADADAEGPDLEALRNEIESTQKEADELRHHLAQSQEDARQATDLAEELLNKEKAYEEEIEAQKAEAERLRGRVKEAEVELERARAEAEAVAEERERAGVRDRQAWEGEKRGWEGKVQVLEEEVTGMEANVEELRAAGQATISLYEQKLSDQETRSYELEDRIRSLEDKLAKSESDRLHLQTQLDDPALHPASPDPGASAGQSAAEIDNETLHVQIKHLQSKIHHLEEQADEARTQLETEAEAWKDRVDKAREKEREKGETVRALREEVGGLQGTLKGAKARVGEMEGALAEVRAALEAARGEIEGLRGDAAEASTLRTALQKATSTEAALADKVRQVEELREKVANYDEMKLDCERYSSQVAALQAELTSLERRSPRLDSLPLPLPHSPLSPRSPSTHLPLPPLPAGQTHRKPRLSTGSQEADEQKMHGYHHVIRELTAENRALDARARTAQDELAAVKAELEVVRGTVQGLREELELSREEVRLLEDIKSPERRRAEAEDEGEGEGGVGEAGGGDGRGKVDQSEVEEWKAKAEQYGHTVKELEKEIADLEHLIESKIYHQDDLENRIHELERELRHANGTSLLRPRDAHSRNTTGASSASVGSRPSPSRSSSMTGSAYTAEEGYEDVPAGPGSGFGLGPGKREGTGRCELCEGPHDLDACPVFAGNLDALPEKAPNANTNARGGSPETQNQGSRRRCADCDSTEHDTADCPLADDVF